MCEAVSKKNLAIPVRVLNNTAPLLRSVIAHYRLSTYYSRDFGFWIGDCITTTLLPSYPPTLLPSYPPTLLLTRHSHQDFLSILLVTIVAGATLDVNTIGLEIPGLTVIC
jgi:hypothetical protein